MAMKKATRKSSVKKTAVKSKTARPGTRAKLAAKYEQSGAPWWKHVPAPPAKH